MKTVVFGVMEGQHKSGRPRSERLDDVKEWRNMDTCRSLPLEHRTTENCGQE